LTGYSRGEVTGRTSIEINFWASPEDRTRMKEVMGKKGWIRNQEYTFRKKAGDGFTGLISAEVIEIDEEPCILSVINDITDRKRMEEELCKSRDELEMRVQQRTAELAKANELLERMFSSIDVLIAYMDKDFNFIRVNRAYADSDEREPEFYVGKNHFVIFPNEENEAIFKKVVETGEPYSVYAKPFEYAEHPERGVTHWDWNLQPVKELDGSVGGVVLSMVNVTERIRAQEAVSAERQRLNDVLEVLPAYVVLLTPDHHVVFANRFFRERFGESHGKRCFEYLFGYSGPCEICETYTVLKTGAPHQWEWTGPDGRIYDVFDFPFTDSDGSALILEMGIDITERREIERQTNATNALLMLFTQKTTRKAYLDALVDLIHDWSKCRCVGIRVRNGQGFIPYESYTGFSEDFRKSEDWLSIDQNQCACIRVVKGKLDPQDASVMTPAGSFRCNNTLKFIDNLSDEEKARYRGVCIEAGFMTVAVIPIRYRDEIIGAIHLADERPEMVPSRMIDFIETMTPLPGEAIHRFNLESELHRNYETQKAINSLLRLSLGDIPLEEFLEGTLDMLISNPWFSPAAKGCLFLAEPHREVLSMKAQYGLPDPIRQRCAQVPFGTCLCGKVALTKKIQYTDYLNDRHDFTFEEATPHSHYHVPILFGERILGLITLYLNEADRPGREKEDFLTAVAHTLASIIVRKKWEEALQESETRLRRLSSQLLTAQEDERRQIARDLHDGVGQMLTALKFKIEDLLERGDPKNVGANAESLESVIPIIRESIEEVRRIQMDLRPSTLDDLGVVATLRWFCREFEKIYSTFHIEKRMDVKENDIPDHLKTVIYRIIQEAMNNIAKHSKANVICLSLEKRGDRIELKVKDNGIGFDPAMARKGFGLGSMRERTEFSGGTFEIESAISAGTKIRASWTI
jgi:PAS domain S-box-containing protein